MGTGMALSQAKSSLEGLDCKGANRVEKNFLNILRTSCGSEVVRPEVEANF